MEMEYKRIDTTSDSFEIRGAAVLFNQSKLNDLICDLDLPKQAAELLASKLKEKELNWSVKRFLFFQNRELFHC